MRQRLAFAARLAELDQAAVADVLKADIDRFARHGRIADVVDVLPPKGDPQARSLMMASFGGLPEQQRDAIVAGINAQ